MNRSGDEIATKSLYGPRAPMRLRKLSLLVAQGPGAGRSVPVDKDIFVIGKDASCDLFFPDPTVSRKHLEIERTGDTFVVRDLGSTNGTTVDGTRIKEAFLSPGSRIAAGNVELIFQPIFEAPGPDLEHSERFGELAAASPSMKAILGLLRKAASTGATVLLRGETGVGKSALAKAVHGEGPRKGAPFVVFDCGSVAPTLIESELFGAERGAYTGSVQSRPGACEQADRGTLFLDEIDALPIELQPKLLRVLDEKEVRRLGSTKPVRLDLHVIAASKLDLEKEMEQGRFRRDLYYRIAVIDIEVPPLRERPEDIQLLGSRFVEESQGEGAWSRLAPGLREQIERYAWPGNLRELKNVVERLNCIGPDGFPLTDRSGVEAKSFPISFDIGRPFKEAKEELIDAFELEYLKRLLDRSDGRVAPAAREAGLNRKYFYDLLKKHGLHGRSE